MAKKSLTPAEFTSQFAPAIKSDDPSSPELQARLRAMATITAAGIDVSNDTIAEALDKLEAIGVTGDAVPLSANQQLAKDYREHARLETEVELIDIYKKSGNLKLYHRLLEAYSVEGVMWQDALSNEGVNGTPLRDQPEAFKIVFNRVQENIAVMIESGARLPTVPIEYDAIEINVLKNMAAGHFRGAGEPNDDYQPTFSRGRAEER